MGRVGVLSGRFNMESLLKNNAESFPCLRPRGCGRGKYLLLAGIPTMADRGKSPETPVQFGTLENGLLLIGSGKYESSREQAL